MQPRVCVSGQEDPGPRRGGAASTVRTVRRHLLPPGACPWTHSPVQTHARASAHSQSWLLIPASVPWSVHVTLSSTPACWHCQSLGLACCAQQLVPCSLTQVWAWPAKGSREGRGLICAPVPTEYLSLCTPGRRGWTAAGGCCAHGSCAKRACPGEVRAAASPGFSSVGGPVRGQGNPDTTQILLSRHRPPGHHSQRAAANGFCVFNNVAIAAAHAKQKHGLHRCVPGWLQGCGPRRHSKGRHRW